MTQENIDIEMYAAIVKNDLNKIRTLSKKININDSSKNNNWSFLHCAVCDGSLEAMILLVEFKADINALDSQNKTPLIRAIEKYDLEKVTWLIQNKAKIKLKDIDYDAIHYAYKNVKKASEYKKKLFRSNRFFENIQNRINNIYRMLIDEYEKEISLTEIIIC